MVFWAIQCWHLAGATHTKNNISINWMVHCSLRHIHTDWLSGKHFLWQEWGEKTPAHLHVYTPYSGQYSNGVRLSHYLEGLLLLEAAGMEHWMGTPRWLSSVVTNVHGHVSTLQTLPTTFLNGSMHVPICLYHNPWLPPSSQIWRYKQPNVSLARVELADSRVLKTLCGMNYHILSEE